MRNKCFHIEKEHNQGPLVLDNHLANPIGNSNKLVYPKNDENMELITMRR